MALADSPEDNQDVSDCVLVQELIDINASTPPLYIVRELQVELRQIALAFDVDQIAICTEAASKARRFATMFMATQGLVCFSVVDEKQHAWMNSVAQEYRDDKVELESSVLYKEQQMSCVYLKSMVNSTIRWSQVAEESDSKMTT